MQKHHRTPCEQVGGYVHTGMTQKKAENKRRDEGKEGETDKTKTRKKMGLGLCNATQRNATQNKKPRFAVCPWTFSACLGYISHKYGGGRWGGNQTIREKKRND